MNDIKFNREYLGVTVTAENYKEIKDNRNFHNKHLRAYLKGNDSFHYGYRISEDGTRYPVEHKVQQKLTVSWTNNESGRTYAEFGSQREFQKYLQEKFGKFE